MCLWNTNRNDHVQYGNSNILFLEIITNVNFYLKMVKCQGQKVKYQHKDLITSNIHVKF